MLTRRNLLTGLATTLLPAPLPSWGRAMASPRPRLAAIDWAAAESLIALGAPPIAISDSRYFETRMPFRLPPGIRDIGPFWEINLEYLARLAPDLILAPASAMVMTPRIAEVASVALVPETVETDRVDLAARLMAEAGQAAGLPPETAQSLTRDIEAALEHHHASLQGRGAVLMALPDVSGRLFTVYGRASLPDAVFARLGLVNAWTGPANAMGTFRTGIEPLLQMQDTTILLVEIAAMRRRSERQLATSALWQAVPAVRAGRVAWIEAFYPAGGLVSARHLAGAIAARLAGL